MIITTLSTNGQIIIPKDVRERHGWRPGLSLEVVEQGDSVLLRPARTLRRTTVDDLFGCLPYRGRSRTQEETEAGVGRGARKSR